MTPPLTGACQCRALRYRIDAEPMTVYACHCTECQRQSGSAFGISMVVPRDKLTFVQGTPKQWERTADSGRKIMCLFCPDCGSRIAHLPEHSPKAAIIRAGTLDDTKGVFVVGHVWTRSAQPWTKISGSDVSYPMQAPDMTKLIEAYAAHTAP
jgi:hypothetical protein